MPRVHPHPGLIVPQTFRVRADTGPYSRTLNSKGSFDVATEREAELLAESFGLIQGMAPARAFGVGSLTSWEYAAEVLADNPIAYYRFDEMPATAGPGLTFVSSSKGSVASVLASSFGMTAGWVIRPTVPVRDGSPGIGGDVNAGARALSPYLDTSWATAPAAIQEFWNTNKPVTCECWFYRGSNVGVAVGEMIFASAHNADGRPYSFFQRNTTGGVGNFTFQPDGNLAGTGLAWTNIPLATWPDQTWVHVAFTWSGGTRQGQLFINGVKYGSTLTAGVDIPGAPLYGLLFGSWYQGTHIWPIQQSHLDEIALYEGVLSDARIAAHYAAR